LLLIINIFKVLVGNVFNKIYPFVVLNLLAITVGPEAVGGYAIFISISGVAAIFVNGGVGPVLVRYLAAPITSGGIGKKAVIDYSVCLSIVSYLLFSFFTYLFLSKFSKIEIPDVSSELFSFLLIVYLAGQLSVSLAKNILLGMRRYTALMQCELLFTLINFGGLIVALACDWLYGLYGYLYLLTIFSVVNGVFSAALVVHARVGSSDGSDSGLSAVEKRRLLGFGIPSLVNAIMFTPVLLIGKFALEHYHGLAALGEFELTFQWATIVLIVTGVVSSMALPELTAHLADYFKLKATYYKLLVINFVISFFLGFFLIILLKVGRNLGVEGYAFLHQIDDVVLFLVLITAVLISVWSVQTKIFAAYERQLLVVRLNILWALACTLFVMIFVPTYGVVGLAFAVSISWLFLVGVFFVFVNRFIRASDEVSSI